MAKINFSKLNFYYNNIVYIFKVKKRKGFCYLIGLRGRGKGYILEGLRISESRGEGLRLRY